MKICKKCSLKKDISEFYKSPTNKDGYMTYCKDCKKKYQKDFVKKNADLIKEKKAKYYKNNKEVINAKSKLWYEENKERALVLSKIWQNENKEKRTGIQKRYYENGGKDKKIEWTKNNKEKRKEIQKRYIINNKEKRKETSKEYAKRNIRVILHKTRLRQKSVLKATPKWADLNEIKKIYKACPEGMHVDHIIPLNNEFVCGLHVSNNLQYLTAFDNLSKGNKFTIN